MIQQELTNDYNSILIDQKPKTIIDYMEFKNADTFEKQINELNNLSLEYQNDQKTFQKKYGNEINEFIENEIIDQIIPDAFDI